MYSGGASSEVHAVSILLLRIIRPQKGALPFLRVDVTHTHTHGHARPVSDPTENKGQWRLEVNARFFLPRWIRKHSEIYSSTSSLISFDLLSKFSHLSA